MPLCSPGPPGVSAKLSSPWDGSSVAQPRPGPSRSHRRVTQAGKGEFCVLLNTLRSDIPKSRCISFSVTEDLFEHPNCSDSFKMNTELKGGLPVENSHCPLHSVVLRSVSFRTCLHLHFSFHFYFDWSVVHLRCCVNFCCTAK